MPDKHGNIDVSKDPSYGGCYQGVCPMGLFVGLAPAPGVKLAPRLIRKDVFNPWKVGFIFETSLDESNP